MDLRARHYQVLGIESRDWRAVGSADALIAKAAKMRQRWLKGSGESAIRRMLALS